MKTTLVTCSAALRISDSKDSHLAEVVSQAGN